MVNIQTISLRSSSLQETRGLTIFLPTEYRPGRSIPVVFCADGQAVGGMSANVASAVRHGFIPPIVLIGVHSSSDKRAPEYISGVNKAFFEAHERFSVVEVPQWLETELRISPKREACGVFGFSNGGAFAVSMGLRHRDEFVVVIAFSIPPVPEKPSGSEFAARPIPRYYLAAGTKEGGFRRTTQAIGETLERHGVTHVYQEREAAHDFCFWAAELPQAIRWAFRRGLAPRLKAIAHYIKAIYEAESKIRNQDEMQRYLDRWINNYVAACGPPSGALAGRFPLADAKIELRDDPSRPEGKLAVMWLRPWLDHGNLTASPRTVIRLN